MCVSVCHRAADILDRVSPKFHRLGLDYECLGGGRIDHDSAKQKIKIYGYSVVSAFNHYNACITGQYIHVGV